MVGEELGVPISIKKLLVIQQEGSIIVPLVAVKVKINMALVVEYQYYVYKIRFTIA